MSDKKIAFVFPGQGSQSVSMLKDFSSEPIVKQTFEQASDALGYDLWQLISEGPVDKLNETHRTQPALLAASIALWRLWQLNAALPDVLAGHSLGEYSALVASEAMNFEQAIVLVEKRGQFMQQAVPTGTGKMAAIIGLDNKVIEEVCEASMQGEVVSPVNYNSPGQVVIAGNLEAVERAMLLCKEKGAKRALPLPVSVPSHCALMKPASESLKQALESLTLNATSIPVINNVDVALVTKGSEVKEALVRQLYCPVRWTESIQFMVTQGVTDVVECGPGSVLSGLMKRIDKSLTAHKTLDIKSFNQAVAVLS